ncbi:MAG: hypothetical protein G9473_14525 [Erythrobacter sp.]|nr:MAG: hypothetical protein G9473_14525 [Erythrobacter sp.]
MFGKELNESVTVSRARILAIATVTLPFMGLLLANHADSDWLSIAGLLIAAIGLFLMGCAFLSMSQKDGEWTKSGTQTPNGN